MKKHVASSDYSATPFAIPNGSAARGQVVIASDQISRSPEQSEGGAIS